MKPKWHVEAAVALVLLLVSAAAWPLSGGPVSGVVIDETTKQPVANAIVVVRWFGDWTKIIGESSSACYHVETARTDANGRYAILEWTRPASIRDIRFSSTGTDIKAYKPGYEASPPIEEAASNIAMKPFVGSTEEYFNSVLSAGWSCDQPGSSGKNLYRLYVALAADARQRAVTPNQMGVASFFRTKVEDSLVDLGRPTTYRGGRLVNTNPADMFKSEDIPQ